MADDRRRRFLGIERARRPGPAAPPEPDAATDARFGALEGPPGPAAPAAAPVAAGHVERFRAAAERPLEVADRSPASQPFVRCARCETDNTVYAARCVACQADLRTEAQRLFNERLWAGRLAQGAAEEQAHARRQAALDAEAAEAARARRAAAEALAREVGAAERQRLDRDGISGPAWGARPPWPAGDVAGEGGGGLLALGAGPRLLALLPDPRWRVAAGVALVAAPALLFVAWPVAGLVAGAAVLALFLPGWRDGRGL